MHYPFSIDTLVLLGVQNRYWGYGIVFLLWYVPVLVRLFIRLLTVSIYSRFQLTYVLLYVACTIAEIVSILNEIFKVPAEWKLLGKDDVALVTGGLAGLGLEVVKSLVYDHQVGKVIIFDIQQPRFKFDSRVEFCCCDIASHSALKSRVDATLRLLRNENTHISVLVNNAGVCYSGSLLNMSEEAINKLFNVNTFAMIEIVRRVVRNHLKFHKNSQLSLVTVSSILGALGPKNLLVYSASKAAITQIHECLTAELHHHRKISMLLVTPGQLTTEMFKDISPSRTFFAPLVNHIALAKCIVEKVSRGESGTLSEPFYANFLPSVKVLPLVVQYWCRWFSQMDKKIPDIP
ncbi:CIC11C00000001860 [Sungouiella intermedia]|uniref:CIC11C00000001860 n=1 Tax=Sungouiella intermedia TaxID=45354 RepID=A0A1L0DAA9_9ASCO|nr:CIC11C00000001860 [[Candida] intermedia]